MKQTVLVLMCLFILTVFGDDIVRESTTDMGEPCIVTDDLRALVTTYPTWDINGIPITGGIFPLDIPDEYFLVDSMYMDIIIPSGGEYVIEMNYTDGALSDHILPYELTTSAEEALEIAPDWMRDDLEWNFHLLSADNQDKYSELILNVSDPRVLDEVIFQVAHISWTILANPSWDETLIENNANWIYTIDDDLQYVTVIDYGGDDYYSTTEYRALEDSSVVYVEIPKELYYWWIVMPKVSDEKPLQDSSVYDYFWREYLYTQHDAGFPLLSDVMSTCEYIWDGEQNHNFSSVDSTQAVHMVTWWEFNTVTEGASGNRPIQPNVIAHEHNGNCGENQDLLCAAARTVLIPTLCTMDILEDHVWCEVWWDDEWHPWQPDWVGNPYIGYDIDMGGSKENSCIWDWRNDGWTWDAIATYSQVCTLSVHLEDSLGVPVDNGRITIASEQYYSPYTIRRGTWGVTDQNGDIQFILGNNQNYYISISTPLGNYPAGGWGDLITNSVAGEHYYFEWKPPSPMPDLEITETTSGEWSKYLIEINYDLPADIKNDRDFWANPRSEFSYQLEDGHLPFFIVDAENLGLYLDGEPFDAYEVADGLTENSVLFYSPHGWDYYIVFSGAEHTGFGTTADISINLWEHDGTGIEGIAPGVITVDIMPNPFSGEASVNFTTLVAGTAKLSVYDITGRLVYETTEEQLEAGANSFLWQGVDDSGRELAEGTYFIHLQAPGIDYIEQVTLLR